RALKKGAQIIVATPGRLLDFIKQGLAKLEQVNTVVLDEADEMISMGFKEALDEILSHVTSESNKWLFSATMSREIKDIVQRFLPSPKQITINKKGGTSDTIEQVYYTVKSMNKIEAVSRILQTHPEFYGIVFCQTKAEVADLSDELNSRGFLVEAIHGDRSQTEREKVLAQFKKAQVKVLVATDVAARGLDIKDLTHVINFNLPWDVESYVHRIGRTGRNGKLGKAYSFVGPDQLNKLARIQRATGRNLIKGKIPTNAEVARISVEQLLERITKNTLSAEKVSLAKELIKDFIAAHAELKHDSPEALARLLVLMQPKIFQTKVDELDYMPGKVPRELQPFDQRDSRGGGEGRGGGGGRRDFRRDSRASFRSTFGSRRDYGSSEGGRDGGGRDGNREGSRDGRRFSGERRDRKDQGPGRSSGQGFEGGGSFRRDRDDRPQFPRSKKGKGSSGRQFFRDE
ncbi:MAG TPA: DEAD/DEAH box helicase, partial [Pseudobdellovibrionaceae bacterium]|nr:DEAD/DEAH box helicase [Pseudobdellovibrionaceae bacterium]